jgi:hypothetical protein
VVFANAYAAETAFPMPAHDVMVTAVFEIIPSEPVQPPAARYTVTVTGGTGGGSYSPGSNVRVSAGTAPEGRVFARWTSDDVSLDDPYALTTSFTMPTYDVAVTAVFEDIPAGPRYTVTVIGGEGASGGGEYAQGATVAIYAGAVPAGQRFAYWTNADGIAVSDPNAVNTSFIMPDRDVMVTAVFEDLEEPGGSGEEPPLIGPDPEALSTVTLTAARPDESGQVRAVLEDEAVEAEILRVKAALAEAGQADEPVSLLITPEGAPEGEAPPEITQLEVTFTPSLIAKLEGNGVEALGISAPEQFQFVLNEAAIAALGVQSAEAVTVTLTVAPADPEAVELSAAAITVLGTRSQRPLVDFSIWAEQANGIPAVITDLSGDSGDGLLTRTIVYQPKPYEILEYLHVVRIEPDGSVTRMADSWYDEAGGRMVWTGSACSYYGVGYGKPEDGSDADRIPVPEKVQVIQGDQVRQYDYAAVLPGGVSRGVFTEDLLIPGGPEAVLLLAGGFWYDVNGVTLRKALEDGRLDDPAPNYQAILEDGSEVGHAAAEIIDWVNGLYPLESNLTRLARAYALYQGLTPAEQISVAQDQAVRDMLEVMEQ